jgi:hypothetical protein
LAHFVETLCGRWLSNADSSLLATKHYLRRGARLRDE